MASKKLLTSDKLPFMVLFFGFGAGILLIFGILLITQTFSNLRSLSRGAPETAIRCEYGDYTEPPDCETYYVKDSAYARGAIGVLLITCSVLLWSIGLRYRTVSIANHNVIIGWGEFLPLPYKTLPAQELKNFLITKEARYMVTPGAGSVQRVSRVPDRWRLTATHGKKKMNLGSYVSEQAAHDAIKIIQNT